MTAEEDLILTDAQLERLADLIAVKLVGMRPAAKQMLTVEDIAKTFRVSRAWVYENARRLGAVKIGPGQRAPLRFDPDVVAAAMRRAGDATAKPESAAPVSKPRRTPARHLLPVYDG